MAHAVADSMQAKMHILHDNGHIAVIKPGVAYSVLYFGLISERHYVQLLRMCLFLLLKVSL